MKRSVSEARIGDSLTRYRTRIEDDESAPNSWESRAKLQNLLRTLTESPDLLNCGYNTPQKISIYHSGIFWVIEAEATLEAVTLEG